MQRLTWEEICSGDGFVGQWVALRDCVYDDVGRAREGALVDSDPDLVELCSRLGSEAHTNCDILFCSRRDHERMSVPHPERRSSRPPSPSARGL